MEERQLLLDKGLRSTMPRLLVINLLKQGPTTFSDIATRLRAAGVNQSTTYRITESFCRHGLILQTGSGPGRIIQLKDVETPSDMHHVRCIDCGTIESFHETDLEHILEHIAKKYGLSRLTSHIVELLGTCRACSAKV